MLFHRNFVPLPGVVLVVASLELLPLCEVLTDTMMNICTRRVFVNPMIVVSLHLMQQHALSLHLLTLHPHTSPPSHHQAVAGGALRFYSNSTGLLKNCSLLGTVSPKNNDIARQDTANVTFACADGEVGTPVQMSGTEITKLPAPTCTAQTYGCHNGGTATWYCVPDTTSTVSATAAGTYLKLIPRS
jgi:hypothetical protein